jgi:hypothetical protein
VNALRAAALALLAATPAAGADGAAGSFGVGYGSFTRRTATGRTRTDGGVALEARVEDRLYPAVGYGLTLTWGLADWDRARAYVDAGNRAGAWTTDQLAQVERWASKKPADPKEDTRLLKFIGLVFADAFLLATYAAVPACYVGSLGGATSYLQVDGTASFHVLERGESGLFLEVGAGAAALPHRFVDTWRGAAGAIGGVGLRVGRLRLGARALWSPPAANHARYGGPVATGAVTVGFYE